jgi:hypothetical protein
MLRTTVLYVKRLTNDKWTHITSIRSSVEVTIQLVVL